MTLTLAQRDAYRRVLDAEVLSCEPLGKQFAVRLGETILYATGGGQPSDRGAIGGVEVRDVYKDEDGLVVHLLAAAVDQGPATIEVDWARRYDLMQQHSAQHLVTAIADDEFGLPTVSFHLGDEYCAIDFACDESPTAATLRVLAARVNDEIRAGRPITWHTVTVQEYGELVGVRSRGLPDGHRGVVRLVEIDGLDLNTCGGTHVANTAELQVVRLGRVERTTEGVRVHYFAGGRVLAQIEEWATRDSALAELLTCAPANFAASVAKTQDDFKSASRDARTLRAELGRRIAGEITRAEPAVVALQIDDDDLATLNAIANEVADAKVSVLLGRGVFLVAGPVEQVDALGPEVRDRLGGRGGGRGGRFQGKVPDGADYDAVLQWANKLALEQK